MKEVLVFGSTGSIGRNSLDVVDRHRSEFSIKGLCAFSDTSTLYKQIRKYSPSSVCVVDEKSAKELQTVLPKHVKLFSGKRGLDEFSTLSSDISIMAIAGISCLSPLLMNIKHAKRIALANKESIVTAGPLVLEQARRFNTEIIPVDSEINALFQLMSRHEECQRLYLTASGGALKNYKKKDLRNVSVKKVLDHPTWKMGKRVTVDSATLVNKGFEVIETHYFFNIPYEKIDIVLHSESMVHAFVQSRDGTFFACMYAPDMRMPISHALCYPQRFSFSKGLDFQKKFSLSFEALDLKKYRLLSLILNAAQRNDNALVALNACDEVAIQYFLKKKIKFTDIFLVLEYIDKIYPKARISSVDDVYRWDAWSRDKTAGYLDAL